MKEYNKTSRKRLFIKVITHYGSECACCGETEIRFLSIDHIEGKGNEHRRTIKRNGGNAFYHWLIDNNYPEGFRILCYNCNLGRAHNDGICPHND
jgi:hypothetical protein